MIEGALAFNNRKLWNTKCLFNQVFCSILQNGIFFKLREVHCRLWGFIRIKVSLTCNQYSKIMLKFSPLLKSKEIDYGFVRQPSFSWIQLYYIGQRIKGAQTFLGSNYLCDHLVFFGLHFTLIILNWVKFFSQFVDLICRLLQFRWCRKVRCESIGKRKWSILS